MKLTLIYILFAGTKYFLDTFVDTYKYHTSGAFFEFFPLFVLAIIGVFIYKEIILHKKTVWTYIKLSVVSILGFLTAQAILFYQWYWIIAPTYRKIPSDYAEGFAWTVFFSLVGSLVILLSYLLVINVFRFIQNKNDSLN